MNSFQEFWKMSGKGFRNKLLHDRKVHAYIYEYIQHLLDKSFSGGIGKGQREGNLLSCGWPWRLWLVHSGTRRRRGALPFFKESPTIVKI